ncbi:MAG: ArgE/DapE family deacylase [Gemmatimonadales bacterium]|nr:ArgE/DapE family deacylase [Gemmatimonadales bacterium]NIN49086.1 ArgE/DapE family deacylase [Gemmatimonadales bacterium]NIP06550.1 ArgE/DapE family deacylase [Gemmatimonadales bacterium]NIR00247.1 ArgE/DapE family deacylase [Gemmatimonadales bacterium]NIS64580.1 ArgE/DapE family deacylase [Gemmatimonadales bacterium]
MQIDSNYVTKILADLVRINSINPTFSDGSTNEREIAEYTADALDQLGMEVSTHEPEPNRMSVVGHLPGAGPGPTLMLYAHMDTVGVDGMTDPFAAIVRGGRLYGRGSYDMKGGLAACIGAAKALSHAGAQLEGDVLVTAVADEEVASIGMSEVLLHHSADAAIVTEPTDLQVCLAHKGFCWIEVETEGRAAHGSRFEEGIDANMRMGRFLAELDHLERALRSSPQHRLVGPPSLHAGVLRGGTGASIYAARCHLEIERRTIPGESEAEAVAEVQDIVQRLTQADPTFKATVRPLLTREPFEATPDASIVRTVASATAEVLHREPAYVGISYWMDAALLAAAGVATVVIGPAGAGAHADDEWVEMDSVVQLADILARAAVAYCSAAA